MREGQAVLGDYLLGMQVGNEPDLYPGRRRKAVSAFFPYCSMINCSCSVLQPEYPQYTQFDYFGEFGDFTKLIANDPTILNRTMLMGPSVSR
jgi:hypothetical protein